MKAVVIGALAASAYSLETYNYAGTYKTGTGATGTCCYPTGDVVITQDATSKVVNMDFDFAAGCSSTAADWAGHSVSGTNGVTPSATTGAVTITDSVGSPTPATKTYTLEVPTDVNGDFNLDLASVGTGCEIPLIKKNTATSVSYAGVYGVLKQYGTTCCYPDGDVDVHVTGSNIQVSWQFNTCTGTGLTTYSDQKISGTGTADTDTKSVSFSDSTFTPAKTWTLDAAPVVEGNFVLDLSAQGTGCAVSLTKKSLPTLSYNKVLEVDTEDGPSGAACCYPAGDITVTQASDNKVTVGWTFESDCTDAVKGKTVSGTAAVPDSTTGDVTIVDATTSKTYTLEAPSTSTGAWKLDLYSIATGCEATLESKSGYVLGLGSLVALSLGYIMF